MGHDHSHAHGHHRGEGKLYAAGIAINMAFVVVEVVYGLLSGSLALVSDAAHNLSDVLALVLSGAAVLLARRKPSKRRTYGFRKASILAPLANALILVAVVGGIVWESIGRLREPRPVQGLTVIVVAAVGIAVNGGSALLFAKGRKRDVNMRSAYLHLAADAAISLGVVVTGVVLMATGWRVLDPIVSIVVSVLVLLSTWGLLKSSLDMIMDAVPEEIDLEDVRSYLAQQEGVTEVHDLHVWPISATEVALTAHLVVRDGASQDLASRLSAELHAKFEIVHATLQVEAHGRAEPCTSC